MKNNYILLVLFVLIISGGLKSQTNLLASYNLGKVFNHKMGLGQTKADCGNSGHSLE